MESQTIIELDVSEYSNFELEKAVCNHGFFMLAPNKWLPQSKTLQRPIRLHHHSVLLSISQPCNLSLLRIHVHAESITPAHRLTILNQVRRMLRLSEKDENVVREFHETHREAKEKGFGRLFRSVSLFEDIVKSMLLCNCSWNRTIEMAAALCNIQPSLAQNVQNGINVLGRKRKLKETENLSQAKTFLSLQNFPTPEELATASKKYLTEKCKLGYRAGAILKLARLIEGGKLNLDRLEEVTSSELVTQRVMKLNGIGEYTCSNILMCMGFYHRIPIDTETCRLIQKVHGIHRCNPKNVGEHAEKIYGEYESFKCLAYWLELLNDYESRLGKLSELPSSLYHAASGTNHSLPKTILL